MSDQPPILQKSFFADTNKKIGFSWCLMPIAAGPALFHSQPQKGFNIYIF